MKNNGTKYLPERSSMGFATLLRSKTPTSYTIFMILIMVMDVFPVYAQLNPIALGRASNVYSIILEKQNQLYANDSLNMVAFIHRQDVTIHGGGAAANGQFRYDLSLDGGESFSKDIGLLNAMNTDAGRYPQITAYNSPGNVDPLNSRFIWSGATIRSGDWIGQVSGAATVTTSSGTLSSSEHYVFDQFHNMIPGGLCQGLPGEFWTVVMSDGNPSQVGDSIIIQKGIYDATSDTIGWMVQQIVEPSHNTSFDGNNRITPPNMHFSPDGTIGWIAFLGDLVGGSDSVYSPIFIRSTDGGATWEDPIEVDLSGITYESGGRSLLLDLSDGVIDSSRIPSCAFDFDITVDQNGNPHMFVNVGTVNVRSSPYSIQSDFKMLALDIFSGDGGLTWKAIKISNINTLRHTWGTGDPVSMDNQPQIARNSDGSHIFYSWVDSDTADLGPGVNSNSLPNLVVASQRIDDGFITCPKWVTLGDAVWDGQILFPTLAPEVLENDTAFQLPIVSAQMLTGNTLEPTQFWYFGNEAYIKKEDYRGHYSVFDPGTCTLSCDSVVVDAGFKIHIDGLKVSLMDTSIGNAALSHWLWDFGDGMSSNSQHPLHSYDQPGKYPLVLVPYNYCASSIAYKFLVLTGEVGTGDDDGDGVLFEHDICPFGDDLKDLNSNLVPDDCECSGAVINLTGSVTAKTTKAASQLLNSSQSIQNNASVTYKSEGEISLLNPFDVTTGGSLLLVHSPCFESTNISQSHPFQSTAQKYIEDAGPISGTSKN